MPNGGAAVVVGGALGAILCQSGGAPAAGGSGIWDQAGNGSARSNAIARTTKPAKPNLSKLNLTTCNRAKRNFSQPDFANPNFVESAAARPPTRSVMRPATFGRRPLAGHAALYRAAAAPHASGPWFDVISAKACRSPAPE
jgi:hypothetical protein